MPATENPSSPDADARTALASVEVQQHWAIRVLSWFRALLIVDDIVRANSRSLLRMYFIQLKSAVKLLTKASISKAASQTGVGISK